MNEKFAFSLVAMAFENKCEKEGFDERLESLEVVDFLSGEVANRLYFKLVSNIAEYEVLVRESTSGNSIRIRFEYLCVRGGKQ